MVPAAVAASQEIAPNDFHRSERYAPREQIHRWDPDEPEIVTLLRRIEREDNLELAACQALSMRSDPLAAH